MADAADELTAAIERFVDHKIRVAQMENPSHSERQRLDQTRAELASAINNALRRPDKGEREALR